MPVPSRPMFYLALPFLPSPSRLGLVGTCLLRHLKTWLGLAQPENYKKDLKVRAIAGPKPKIFGPSLFKKSTRAITF